MLKSVETLNAESASLNGLVELAYVFIEFSDNWHCIALWHLVILEMLYFDFYQSNFWVTQG